MQKARLTRTLPNCQVEEWEINQSVMMIGRTSPANIILSLPNISRRHARIQYHSHGYFQIQDIGSRYGTILNGKPVDTTPRRLYNDDEIILAKGALLNFTTEEAHTALGPIIGRINGVWVDKETEAVWVDRALLTPALSSAQYTLLCLLYDSADTYISNDKIIRAVWPHAPRHTINFDTVKGIIRRLKDRLRSTHLRTNYIQVKRGSGVRLIHPKQFYS